MYKNTAQFLDTLDRESRRYLDTDEAIALRSEIEGHLDAAIAARMELGSSYEEAEREAVAEFGNLRKVVRAMRDEPKHPWFDKNLFAVAAEGWTLLYTFAFIGMYFYGDFVPVARYAILYGTVVMAGIVLAKSIRLHRLPLRTFLALYLFLIPFGAIGLAVSYIPHKPGDRMVTRHAAKGEIRFIQDQRAGWQAILDRYETHRREFMAGSLVAPTLYETSVQGAAYVAAADRTVAAARWAEADRVLKAEAVRRIGVARSLERAYRDRMDRHWWLSVPGWLFVSATIMATPALLTLFSSALGIGLGWISRRWGKGRRRIA